MSVIAPLCKGADRVCVIGLDCASPWLLFDALADAMPRLTALRQTGAWGRLRSCHPPITVPAWRVMSSGHDAGFHGVYGFRNRLGATAGYDDLSLVNSRHFGEAVWDRLGALGMRTTLVGLPGTWPVPALQGSVVAGPLAPDLDASSVSSPQIQSLIQSEFPGYAFDIRGFRNMAPLELVAEVRAMTEQRFGLVMRLAEADDWNLLWMVEIGLDRLYHALWHHIDPSHMWHDQADPALREALVDYHRLLDRLIGDLVDTIDDGDTATLVVSDHGAKAFEGGFAINRFLVEVGYLTLLPGADSGELDITQVDWANTKAWSTGGYYARLFINIAGREPEGIVAADDVDALVGEIATALAAVERSPGERLEVACLRPQDLYANVRGRAPEAMIYLGDLGLRAIGQVGPGPLFEPMDDRGFDAANHDWDGVWIAFGGGVEAAGERQGAQLIEVAGAVEAWLD